MKWKRHIWAKYVYISELKNRVKIVLWILAVSTIFFAYHSLPSVKQEEIQLKVFILSSEQTESEWFQIGAKSQCGWISTKPQEICLTQTCGTRTRRKHTTQIKGKARDKAQQIRTRNKKLPPFPCIPTPSPAKEISRNGRKLYWKYWKDEKGAEGLKENRLENITDQKVNTAKISF